MTHLFRQVLIRGNRCAININDFLKGDKNNENFASDYATAVPNKAWVREPALSDPVCYTKKSTGSECTTTIELSIEPPLTHSVNVTVKGKYGSSTDFTTSTSLNGSSTIVGPMNLTVEYASDRVLRWTWVENWYINVDGTNDRFVGTSQNTAFSTWSTPGGTDKKTAKRMDWVCWAADGATTTKAVADGIHTGLNNNPPNDGSGGTQTDTWALLDGTPYKGECDEQASFMERALIFIGSTGDHYKTMASRDSSDVEDLEDKTVDSTKYYLCFDFDNNGWVDNRCEASVASASHYYAVWPNLDASSKCQLLREVGPDFYGAVQRWAEFYNDDFWNEGWTGNQLPGTEGYPSCP